MAPTILGGLGVRGAGLGSTGLGGAQQAQPFAFSAMPSTALPYVAHLFNYGMQFKRTLGDASSVGSTGSAMITKPGLKMTRNGGYHPITLELAGAQLPANLVVDPGFEASDVLADVQANWTLLTPSEWALLSTATDMRGGRRGLKCTRTNLGPNNWNTCLSKVRFAVVAGLTYTFSAWSKQIAGTKSSRLSLDWYDAAGVLISSSLVTWADGVQPWTFRSSSATAPSNAKTAVIDFQAGWWDGATGTNAQTWFDDGRVVQGVSTDDPIEPGDVIQLTENGDNSGAILYSGIVEEMPDEIGYGASGSKHQVTLTPFVAELADTDFNQQYVALVDVAQMVRDAVNLTGHCRVSQMSCGDTGVKGIWNFNQTNCLEVLNVAKRIAGVNFWWFVDATGLVWFQSATPTNPPRITLKRGSDFTRRRRTPSIVGMKNKVRALGGFVTGSDKPITSTYSNLTSQKKYGKRVLDPPLIFPTVTDQATLDTAVNTVGLALDRIHKTVDIDVPALSQRLTLAVPGGLTVRVWEPASESIAQPTTLGSGDYSTPFPAQDIEVNGIQQKLLLSDVPTSIKDLEYELVRIIQRATQSSLVQPPFVGNQ